MAMETITFNQLRKIKDALPDGSIKKMSELLKVSEETIRNHFAGDHFKSGKSVGIHYEQGPDGGLITFDDPTIVNLAKKIIAEEI
jgi:transcriptional antiterminator